MSTETLLADLLLRWEHARDHGEPVTPEQLCQDNPELLDEVRLRVAALESIDRQLVPRMDETVTASSEQDHRLSLAKPDYSRRNPAAAQPTKAPADDLPSRVGRYRVGDEIARGGMGRIVRVRDDDFERSLALKVLLSPEPIVKERFLREARLTGRLQHPGIPPVHELGSLPDGRPYFIMKLIQGRTLRDILRERRNDDLPRLLGIFEHICQTVGYAHSRGVIHRDLKPANIMVGPFGEVQVMDWGLAKFKDAPADIPDPLPTAADETMMSLRQATAHTGATVAGSILGTPAYMAPEQARGEVADLDVRADVFGIGAILCEILTGQPPYIGPTALVQAAQADLEPALGRLGSCGADAALIDLAQRCLSANRKDRPGNAAAVTEEVAKYQTELQRRLMQAEKDRTAAEVQSVEEAKRRLVEGQKRKIAVALLAAVALVTALGIGAFSWAYNNAIHEKEQADLARNDAIYEKEQANLARNAAEEKRILAEEKEALAENNRVGMELQRAKAEKEEKKAKLELRRFEIMHYLDRIAAADKALDENDPQGARQQLDDCRLEFRHLEYDYLANRLAEKMPKVLSGHSAGVTSIALSSDGKTLFSGSYDKTIRVWGLESGKEVLSLRGHTDWVLSLALSADGKTLFSGSGDRTIIVWDVSAGKATQSLRGHTGGVSSVALSADGKKLFSGGFDSTIKVWNLEKGNEIRSLRGHTGGVSSVALSKDGERLYSGSWDSTIKVWSVKAANDPLSLLGHRGDVQSLAMSVDGKRLYSGSSEGTIKVWDLEIGKETLSLRGHAGGVSSLAVSADGKRLFTGGDKSTIKVWDLEVGKVALSLRGQAGGVISLVLSADRKRLFSGSEDGTINVWEVGPDN